MVYAFVICLVQAVGQWPLQSDTSQNDARSYAICIIELKTRTTAVEVSLGTQQPVDLIMCQSTEQAKEL